MAPCRKAARLFVGAVLLGEACVEMERDQLAKLGEDGQLCPVGFAINHLSDPKWDRPPVTPKNHRLWDGCEPKRLI